MSGLIIRCVDLCLIILTTIPGGSKPRVPALSRSASDDARPLLANGLRSRSHPCWGGGAGAFPLPLVLLELRAMSGVESQTLLLDAAVAWTNDDAGRRTRINVRLTRRRRRRRRRRQCIHGLEAKHTLGQNAFLWRTGVRRSETTKLRGRAPVRQRPREGL